MAHVSVVIFVVAVVAALVRRLVGGRVLSPPLSNRPSRLVSVLFAAPAASDWRDVLWHLVTRAREPRAGLHVHVLLECTEYEEVEQLGNVDSELRAFAQVHLAPRARNRDPARVVRRLARRFVRGDEALVVVLDPRARLVHGWNDLLWDLLEEHDGPDVVLSCPTAVDEGTTATFPTMRARSNGTAARDASRPFKSMARVAVPSVCWCAELTACAPAALRDWPHKSSTLSAVAQTSGRHHVVPAVPVVESGDLEEEFLEAEEGTPNVAVDRAARVGLTPHASDEERIRKFGSSRDAELAVAFATL